MSLFGPKFRHDQKLLYDEFLAEKQYKKSSPKGEVERWNNMVIVMDTLIEFSQKFCPSEEWHFQINREIIWERYLEAKSEAFEE